MKKILVITLSNIGDAILTTPVLEALQSLFPRSTIDLVCDPRSVDLFRYCPYLGTIFVRKKSDGWMGYVRLIRTMRKQRYDLAVDLKTDFLLYTVLATQKMRKIPANKMCDEHSVIKHLAVLKALLPIDYVPQMKLWAAQKQDAMLEALIKTLQTQRYLVLGLGANFQGKIWPPERYAELTNQLTPYFDAVLLLGDVKDRAIGEVFKSTVHLPVTDCCGLLTLSQSYALLRHATYFIGNDSGLGHMAAAAGVPTFTIFGSGSPQRYLPWSEKSKFYQDPQQNVLNITVTQLLPDLLAAISAVSVAFKNPIR